MDTCYFLLGCIVLVTVAELFERSVSDPSFQSKVVTGDESWVYEYDPETKAQSSQWKGTTSPKPKKGFQEEKSELRFSKIKEANAIKRFIREIRRGFRNGRQGRLYFHAAEEAHDPRNMLLLNNPPREPLHDLYRKGFSYLHVPDFHRRPQEPRIPRRGNQTIDEIIGGIIQLLGGDVHVTRAEGPPRPVPPHPPSSSGPSRINNRGPGQFNKHPPESSSDSEVSSLGEIVNTEPITEIDATTSATSSTSRWLFPDDTEVSLILGLLNQTDQDRGNTTENSSPVSSSGPSRLEPSFVVSSSVVSSNGIHNLGELTPSVEINITLPSVPLSAGAGDFVKQHGIIQSSFSATSSDATLRDPKDSQTSFQTLHPGFSHGEHKTTEESDTSYKYRPIISSAFTEYPTPSKQRTTDHLIPTGPVTEWVPIATLPTQYLYHTVNRTNAKEPVIITEPTQFEVTVSQQINNGNSSQTTTTEPTQWRRETVTDITNSISITATHQLNSQEISVAIISTQVGIIYGRPSKQPDHSLPATGRPHVFAVDISEIRPSKRPTIYQRPPPPLPPRPAHSEEGYSYGNNGLRPSHSGPRPGANVQRRPTLFRPPTPAQMPEIRIDTCVVGDDTTCDIQLEEHCRTERGVSSCICRPGFGRVTERGMCSPVVSMLLTIKVAKVGDRSIDPSQLIPGSQEYQRLQYEANHAMATVFSYSPLADGFRGASVNGLYFLANRMVINSTIHLAESEVRGSLRHHVEHAVAAAISRHANQVGDSQLFVRGPLSALVEVEDLNECANGDLNDCSEFATCENLFGTFQCFCKLGYTDKSPGGMRSSGRVCSACSPDYCHGRGTCVIISGFQECRCRGNYAGVRCQVDNEVVGVSVGVSVIAAIVIAITAACLYLWNKRWKQAQQKTDAAKNMGYRLQTIADHVRYRAAVNTLGSTYVPADSTLQLAPPPMTTSASHLYALPSLGSSAHQHRNHLYDDDINPYGRINRTLQKPNNNQESSMLYESLSSECGSSDELGFPSVPSNSFVYHGTFPHRPAVYR